MTKPAREVVVEVVGHTPVPGDYYRVRKDIKDDFKAGQIVVVDSLNESKVRVQVGTGSSWAFDPDEFEAAMVWLPDGPAAVQAAIERAVVEMTNLEATSAGVRGELGKLSAPHIEVTEGAAVSEEALVPAVRNIAETRGQIAKVRNDLALIKVGMASKQSEVNRFIKLQKQRMEAIFRAQADALTAKLGDLNDLLKKAEEAIWTINLYLGKNEEIVQIKKGKPAHKDSKISIRQLVLYADEECALGVDEGGIDAHEIREFDKWLTVPAHRQQVLPEAKGVVAFKPRRKKKDYGNDASMAWADAQADVANKKTYFFMVNGENLYRICTELEVGDRIIPVENEHSELFFRSEFDYKKHEYRKEPIYPGDKEYMKSLEAADGLKKHYMRILLFLQGLLDRTAVFAPLPAPRLNLLNRAVYNDHLNFITDAEKLLDTGKPPFRQWIKSINAKLDVGHRIIGSFSSWDYGLRHYRRERSGGNERISPPMASYPDDLKLYTIEGRQDGQWFFRYDRDDTIYRKPRHWGERPEDGPAKRRASCRIEPGDEFILNFDAADVRDMEFYLGNRANRHDYAYIFPLLKKGVELKHQEVKEEAPFRDLLARQISKTHDVKLKDAEAAIGELVDWWKLKNRTHRALLSDDGKALRMIVAEFGRRRRRKSQQAKLDEPSRRLIEHVQASHPDVLLIAHKKGKDFLVLVPENDGNVFVAAQEWYVTGEAVGTYSVKNWQVVERKSIASLGIIYESPRWTEWQIDARPNEHLTDPEYQALIKKATPGVLERIKNRSGYTWRDEEKHPLQRRQDIVAVTRGEKERGRSNTIILWVWSERCVIPTLLLSGHSESTEVVRLDVHWEKKNGEVEPVHTYTYSTDHPSSRDGDEGFCPWSRYQLVTIDERLAKELGEDALRYTQFTERKRKLETLSDAIGEAATAAMQAQILSAKKAAFLVEYEHEDLWEDHKKTIKERDLVAPRPLMIRSCMERIAECHYRDNKEIPDLKSFVGWTYGRVVETARILGWKPETKGKKDSDDKKDSEEEKKLLPLDDVIEFAAWRLKDDDDEEGEDEDSDEEVEAS